MPPNPLAPLAAFLLLLTPPGTPSGGFHWQRILTPPPGAGLAQACVVLDAATFANAAPALRDLRLFQDGAELPYVIEESYDERALQSGVTPADDRSAYEPVLVLPLTGMPAAGSGLNGSPGKGPRQAWSETASIELPKQVPVERLRLEPAPAAPARLFLQASEEVTASGASTASGTQEGTHAAGSDVTPVTESLGTTVSPEQPAWPLTLGANLQHASRVVVRVETEGARPQRVVLEMRRRSLCYQPRSGGPLMLYLGGGEGMAAKVYGLANGFSTAQDRPYGTLGPLEPNPDLNGPTRRSHLRLLLALLAAGTVVLLGMTVLFALRLLRPRRPA